MLNDVPLDIINIIISYIYNPKLALSNITNNMQSCEYYYNRIITLLYLGIVDCKFYDIVRPILIKSVYYNELRAFYKCSASIKYNMNIRCITKPPIIKTSPNCGLCWMKTEKGKQCKNMRKNYNKHTDHSSYIANTSLSLVCTYHYNILQQRYKDTIAKVVSSYKLTPARFKY